MPSAVACSVESAANATVPDNVPAAEKFTAPADDTPVPEIVNGSADVTPAATSNVAPDDTVVPCPAAEPPSADASEIFTVPAEIVVAPVYVFTPDNDSVPVPVPPLVNANPPDTTPDTVAVVESATCTVESAANATVPDNVPPNEKFTAPADDTPVPEIVNGSADVTAAATSNVAPDDTVVVDRVPANSPNADASEIFTVPTEIVVAPVYVFAADNVNVPVPVLFVSAPAPEITPDNVWFDDDE